MAEKSVTREILDGLVRHRTFGDEQPVVVETHISWVLLVGGFAWKVKKPVRFPFVDFSTLAARHEACLEELRLNARLAPELYLEVVAIHGSRGAPTLREDGPAIEYAVKMRRFPPDAVLGEMPEATLEGAELAALAELLGDFHSSLPPAPASSPWGRAEKLRAPIDDTLRELGELLQGDLAGPLLPPAASFVEAQFARCEPLFDARRGAGAVRECHGDLHLGNLVRIDGRIVPFDALEFDPALRWIDVISEIAFLLMDLDTRGHRALAFGFLNHYLDVTGEHDGLPLLPFYLAYRALVRAKVCALSPAAGDAASRDRLRTLLTYAASPLRGLPPLLVLMCGISGSGKSWLAHQLATAMPAIHVRSDVERKRLFGMPALTRTAAPAGAGIYGSEASLRTYDRLARIAAASLDAELPVIVDATSLRREHRASFIALARRAGCPVAIVACHADDATIAERIRQRASAGRDPSEATMDIALAQKLELEPPHAGEADLVWSAGANDDVETLAGRLRELAHDAPGVSGRPALL